MKRFWLLTLLITSFAVGGSLTAAPLTLAQEDPAQQEKPTEDKPAAEKAAQESEAQEESTDEKPQEPPATQEEEKKEEATEPEAEQPAEPAAESQEGELTSEVITAELNNPCGIAIQPETGTVFVADSGNLQILRLVDGKMEPVITEFPSDVYGKGPKYTIGPLGLCFLDKDTLVVGGGGLPDGEELLRVYKVPAPGEAAIKADQQEASMPLAAEGDVVGEGNFYALVASPSGVYATLNGDDAKGWIGKATREGSTLKDFTRFIATKEATEVDAPVGITMTEDGFLAVGQMGEITVPGDALLSFYSQEGNNHGNFKTGLSDITALAYSSAGHLYALDFCWNDISKGGLFRLVADGDAGCVAKPMMSIEKPTAMVFDDEGNLWVTSIGTAESESQGGQLLKITGLPK